MTKPLEIGDRVGYAAAFLRSTSQFSGGRPFMRGAVVALEDLGEFKIARVLWDGHVEPQSVNVSNLARKGSIAWAGV